ncbi:MAG: hypothetical protein CME65_14600 [Halobacteriovoraceae bacterium]|nr:hypothetical protein [Halobacteriovoraceae bacterium]|tara:strand:+ start:4343 stop:4765 length:423 start_codon:yes stop_codon:yes gene_type:complete
MEEKKKQRTVAIKQLKEIGLVRIDEKLTFKFTEEEKKKILDGRKERAIKNNSTIPQKVESYYCLADKVKQHKKGNELLSNIELRLCSKVPTGDYIAYGHWFMEVDSKTGKPLESPMALVACLIPMSSVVVDEESYEVYNK